ncbi:hypothetical protein [Litoribrevibacter albus]|uniref:Uncharacterized protein n=1 Tax=Litoribrevibacter albus TaxID=1473156 RepID=A0AA37SCR0_9GAMM|nr:hypothetical protein [Litoribrevibacter albus]GLQ32300.1 hypothetical protein GCM10007876_27790 [Litoribrevibacter albus]
MKHFMTLEEIEKAASNGHATADQLDLLISNTREMANQREQELTRLKGVLDRLEARLEEKGSS